MGAHVSVPMYRRTIPQRLGLEGARCGGAPPEFSGFAHAGGSYYVGIVTLEEGPRITAMLVDFDIEPWVDGPVRAVVRRLYEEEGVVRYGFKFARDGVARGV